MLISVVAFFCVIISSLYVLLLQ